MLDGTWLYYHPDCDESQPVFPNVQRTKDGLFSSDHLVLPCFHDKELVLVVQASYPTSGAFCLAQETLLRVLIQATSQALSRQAEAQKQQTLQQRLMTVGQLAAECAHAKTLEALGEAVYSLLPGLAQCEAASLVLRTEEGLARVYPRLSRMPLGPSVSAAVVAAQGTLFVPELSKEPGYVASVDDPFGLGESPCVMACVPNTAGEVVGLLQLFNKGARDELVESVKAVVGCGVERLSSKVPI